MSIYSRLPIFLVATGILIFASLALRAKETITPGRVREIADWLPAQPAGFAWPITNRVAWAKLTADHAFANTVKKANAALKAELPAQPDSWFLEFSQSGNRTHWQDVAKKRRDRIEIFTLAEAIQNQGR